jgi:hypothetical protein
MHKVTLSLFLILTVPAFVCHADPQITTPVLPVQNLIPAAQHPMQPVEQLKPIVITPKSMEAFKEKKKAASAYKDFLSYSSLNESKAKKKVALVKVNNTRKKQAFMFVFLMNKPTTEVEPAPKTKAARKNMHIMWSGSKKIVPEQKNIENKYPVDVSIDNYSDGFAPGQWNLALPNKKPREISVSFLWAF